MVYCNCSYRFYNCIYKLIINKYYLLIVSVVMGIFTIIVGSAIKNLMHSIANIEDNSADQLEYLKLIVKQNINKSNEELKVE